MNQDIFFILFVILLWVMVCFIKMDNNFAYLTSELNNITELIENLYNSTQS